MKEISFWISVIALIISFLAPLFEYWWSKKLNKINIESEYFDKVYTDFLMIKLPEARLKISYVDNKIKGIDDYIDVLRDMRKKSIYFKFANNNFYNSLLRKIQELEDLIILGNNNQDYGKFVSKFDEKEKNIYKCICNGHLGKKQHRKIRIKFFEE